MTQRKTQILLILGGVIIGLILSMISPHFFNKHMSTINPLPLLNAPGMKVTRLYTGEDGQSHFEEKAFSLTDTKIGKITEPLSVNTLIFGETGNIKEVSWHTPPSPCFLIMLEGTIEIEVGNGNKKIFKEGDILLAEDTTGQGHITRNINHGRGRYMMITIKKD